MKYSDIKQIRELVDEDGEEIVTAIDVEETDISSDSWRVVRDIDIDEIMQDELASDEYILGCFNDWFLANVLDIDIDAIQAMQKAEAFEAIGKLILSMGKIGELQEAYVSADGYGHHFAHYDHEDHEIEIDGLLWHFFRVN